MQQKELKKSGTEMNSKYKLNGFFLTFRLRNIETAMMKQDNATIAFKIASTINWICISSALKCIFLGMRIVGSVSSTRES